MSGVKGTATFSEAIWPTEALDRFDSRVEIGPVPAIRSDLGCCHLWTGGVRRSKGTVYGRIVVGSHVYYVHRVAFERWVRALLPGEDVDHLCFVTLCVRPSHLEAVTRPENVRRQHARHRGTVTPPEENGAHAILR